MLIAFIVFSVVASAWTFHNAYRNPGMYGLLGYAIILPFLGLLWLNHLVDRHYSHVPRWSLVIIWFAWTLILVVGTLYAARWAERQGR